jgi:hypothetical protein
MNDAPSTINDFGRAGQRLAMTPAICWERRVFSLTPFETKRCYRSKKLNNGNFFPKIILFFGCITEI